METPLDLHTHISLCFSSKTYNIDILGRGKDISAPMADRSYSGFSRTSEQTTKSMRSRKRTFFADSNHTVFLFSHLLLLASCGFTVALAPRIPTTDENVVYGQVEAVKTTVLPRGSGHVPEKYLPVITAACLLRLLLKLAMVLELVLLSIYCCCCCCCCSCCSCCCSAVLLISS